MCSFESTLKVPRKWGSRKRLQEEIAQRVLHGCLKQALESSRLRVGMGGGVLEVVTIKGTAWVCGLSKVYPGSLTLQIAQSRYCLQTLDPKVGTVCILGVLGD